MGAILTVASVVLFFIVGVICLFMAYTTLFAKQYLPFHEEGAGMKWDEHPPKLQATILALVNLSGLGFLVVGLMLLVLPILNAFDHSLVLAVSIPILALVFCAGLFYFNYQLHKKTRADTPWKGAIAAMLFIVVAFVLTLLAR